MKLKWFAIIFLVLAVVAPIGYVVADKLGVLVNGVSYLVAAPSTLSHWIEWY